MDGYTDPAYSDSYFGWFGSLVAVLMFCSAFVCGAVALVLLIMLADMIIFVTLTRVDDLWG